MRQITTVIENQNKDSYNREKTTGVSAVAANPAKKLGAPGDPCGNTGLSFVSKYII